MKKTLLVVLALLVIFSVSAFAQFNVKVGMDFSGEFTEKYESIPDVSVKVENGFTIAGEYVMPYSDEIDFGVGVAYQLARGYDEVGANEDVTFNFIPIYGVAKYNIEQFYVLGQLGYNILNISDEHKELLEFFNSVNKIETKGGLYYGIGGGMNFTDNIFGEILYSVNNGCFSAEGLKDLEIINSQISAMVGFSF